MNPTVKIGRWLNQYMVREAGAPERVSDPEEALVVAVVVGGRPSIERINEAARLCSERAMEIVKQVPKARIHEDAYMRHGWDVAVVIEVAVPRGEGKRHGFKEQRSKL